MRIHYNVIIRARSLFDFLPAILQRDLIQIECVHYKYAKYKNIESKAITLQFTYRFAIGKLKSETKLNQSFIISTEGAFRRPMTYDNHPSHLSHPFHPHIAYSTTSHN